jgi:hypothetical protein
MGSIAQGNFKPNWEQIPIARRFYRDDYSSFKTTKRYYNLRDRVLIANKYLKKIKSGEGTESDRESLKINKALILVKGMMDGADAMRKTIAEKQKVVTSSKISESKKEEEFDKLEKQRVAVYRNVLIKAKKLGIQI